MLCEQLLPLILTNYLINVIQYINYKIIIRNMKKRNKIIKYTLLIWLLGLLAILICFTPNKFAIAAYTFGETFFAAENNNVNTIIPKVFSKATPLSYPVTNSNIDPQVLTQVKTANSDIVYYLDHGRNVKKSYVNPQGYLAYGNRWDEIKIISQAELDKWRDLRVVSSRETQDIFYIGNNRKVKIDPIYFDQLGITKNTAVNIHPIDLATYAYGTYAEVGLAFLQGTENISNNISNYKGSYYTAGTLFGDNISNLYIYNGENNNLYYTKGQKKVEIAKFFVEISAIKDVIINNITLTRGNTYGSISFENGFSNMELFVSGRKCGTIEQPRGGSFIFKDCNAKLQNGKRYEIIVKVDINENLNINQTQLKLTDLFATDVNSGFPTVVEGKNSLSYVTNFGKVNMNIEILKGGQITRGTDNNIVGSFILRNNGNEDILLQNMNITTSLDGFSYTLGYSDLKIAKANNNEDITIATIKTPVGGSNKFNFSGNTIIEINKEITYDIYVNADNNVPIGNFNINLNRIVAIGKDSRVEAIITGAPTKNMNVRVN